MKELQIIFQQMNNPFWVQDHIEGENMPSLASAVVELCNNQQYFQRDIITGLFRLGMGTDTTKLLGERDAKNQFEVMFLHRMKIRNGNTLKTLNQSEVGVVWETVKAYCTFDSRKELYGSIELWDGVPRIDTFMKKYYECSAPSSFFRLFLTCLVAKMKSPKNYTPFFFDFVCPNKGVGKSLLSKRLVGLDRVYEQTDKLPSRFDDFYVDIYNGNKLIVVDDECHWVGAKGQAGTITPDVFKAMVTKEQDTFSRKFGQPETHDRSFIIVRTSNDVNTVFSTNERRQIVFPIGLKANECRILELPDEFFRQLLAEAKAYFEANGIYKLTDEDWSHVKQQNALNFNAETTEYRTIIKFILDLQNDAALAGRSRIALAGRPSTELWVGWSAFDDWCQENKKKTVDSRVFWRQIKAIANIERNLIMYDELDSKKVLADGTGTKRNVFLVIPKSGQLKPVEEMEDIDIGF